MADTQSQAIERVVRASGPPTVRGMWEYAATVGRHR